jgi:hypothetical protein
VRGENELEGDAAAGGRELPFRDAGPLELRECVGERLPGDSLLVLVLAAATQPVVLLRQVDELEVERERAQDLGLALEGQVPDRLCDPGPRGGGAGRTGAPGELPDALLVREQLLAALLDENPAEDVTEQADVAPERRVGARGSHGESHLAVARAI